MARPYMSPMDRKRRGVAPAASPMGEDSPPGESDVPGMGEPPEPPQSGESGSGDDVTAFIPKEMTTGRNYKPGDSIEMKVKAVDPETGELEVSCAPSSDNSQKEGPSVTGMDSLGEEKE